MKKYNNPSTDKHYHPNFYFIYVTLIAFALSGCGTLVTGRAWFDSEEVKPTNDKVVVIGEVKSAPAIESANKFALMALFAKVVYRKDLSPDIRYQLGCAYLPADADVPEVGMPRKADGSGWKRWKGTTKAPEAIACFNNGGLSYETYVHETVEGTLDEAVIAFRGTENYNLREKLEDWGTNLGAALGVEPPQYKAAQSLIPKLIDGLVLQSPSIKIYATGHSLGGGLAQQAGYVSKRILEVYAFDPSPVTNWSFLAIHNKAAIEDRKDPIIQNTDPTIYRVYHWHEGLAYVRNVTSRFNTRRFGRADYEFYFQQVPPIAAHEMGILACHLSRLIQGNEADHGYSKDFAMFVTSANYNSPEKNYFEHPVCPPSVKFRD